MQGQLDQLGLFHVHPDANDWLHGAQSTSPLSSHYTNMAFSLLPPIACIQGDKVFDSI